MASDCYRVEILHYINPHLIWVEVNSEGNEFIFEQLGIFGVLPLEFSIDVLDKRLKTKRSKEWIPAASALMIALLEGAKEVWFTTTLIDQRTTIFDDNIFKFGEIIIVSQDDTQTHLSKALVDGGYAIYDACLFHQELANGKLNIKLSPVQTQEVIKQFNRHYRKKNKKEQYEKSLKSKTTVSQTASEIQSTLTIANLEKHNMKQANHNMLTQKIKVLQLCKGIDEESVGRACKTTSSDKTDVASGLLKKKLDIAKERDKQCNPADMFNITKEFIDKNAVKKETSNGLSPEKDIMKETKKSMYVATKQIEDKYDTLIEDGKEDDVENKIGSLVIPRNDVNAIGATRKPPNALKNSVKVKETSPNTQSTKISNSTNRSKPANPKNPKLNFGPPELTQFSNKLKMVAVENTAPKVCKQMLNENPIKTNIDPVNKKNALKSKLLQRKFIIHKEKEQYNRSLSSGSETTNKDTNDKATDAKDDELDRKELQDLEIKLSEEYKPLLVKNKKEETAPVYMQYNKNNVNPFNNVDANISVFVDKLVTPVLMVHNKMNKRIEPRCELRDVPFNKHIHAVLRNMRVVHPMTLQTVSWPTVLRGHSIFMISPLGSGKTMGYLPAVCRLVSDSQVDSVGSVGPTAIIVCATSRSVTEIATVAKMFLGLKEKVLACYAGMDEFHITTSLLNGCDLMVCTPSVLVRLLHVSDFGVDLRRLTTFVLDDCERLHEVYAKETKFFLLKIKEMLKNRANKELKVQYILASRLWCDFMEPLAKKAPDSVICIGAFQECVLYSKTPTTVKFVTQENKPQAVLDFLEDIDISKRIVIVCRTDNEVKMLEKVLEKKQHTVYACDNTMTVHDLYNLNLAWADDQDPILGPILLCCDYNLAHMNITDACYLLHYSLPQMFSTFSKRFAVLNDSYASIFNTETTMIKIHVLVDDTNVEQLPKILNFIKRCTSEVPEVLKEISDKVLAEKNLAKAQNYVPVCDNLLALGECPDFWNCQERHAVFKDFDEPKQWMPRNGIITFKVLYYHTAVLYSARLITNIDNGQLTKYPQTYSTLSLKMGMYFSKESNKRPHGIPKVGDICAVSLKQNYFARCQILKILNYHPNDTPNYVFIKLIDEEKYERSQDVYLYHLPDELKNIESYVIQVRLANIQPKDRDVTFSNLARNQLMKITTEDEELYMRGKVTLTVGNCVFVDTLEACQSLTSLNEIVVKHDFKKELLNAHAIVSSEHLNKLLNICSEVKAPDSVSQSYVADKLELSGAKIQVNPQWAHLEHDDISSVFFASAVSPGKFFVRLAKFEDCMNILSKNIQNYVSENQKPASTRHVGDIVLARFPDDGVFERARIDEVFDEKVKCFFVDQGDWRNVHFIDIMPITDKIITQMPFQAIECRLIGVKPLGDNWTEFSTNWLCDNCYEDNHEYLKNISLKYFTKEKAESSGGNKYGVVLIDTTGKDDVIINTLLIDANLAMAVDDEIHYLNELQFTRSVDVEAQSADEDEWEKIADDKTKENTTASQSPNNAVETVSAASLLLRQPTRSIPLVGDDDSSDDSDKWDMNMTHEFINTLKPHSSQTVDEKNLLAIKENQQIVPEITPTVPEKGQSIKSLDSDDLTTPEYSDISEQPKPILDQKRKPKLVWRQTKTTISVKIFLICEEYQLEIQQNRLIFTAQANDTVYGFDIDLYGVLVLAKCRHANKGQYILVNLTKLLPRNWLTFAKEGVGNKWITYDVESIDTSSDEEEVNKDDLVNIVKKMYDKTHSDSDDDEFLDDVNFTYRK